MKLHEHFSISRRAIKHLFSLDRTYAVCMILASVLDAATPYIPIYFSALLVDALFAAAPVGTLALYAALTVGLTFLAAAARQLVESVMANAQNRLWRSEAWKYCEKAMELAYESIEDGEVKRLLERIKNESQTGCNLWYLTSGASKLILSVSRVILSFLMIIPLFALPAIPIYMKLAILAGIALTVAYGVFATAKSMKLTLGVYDKCVDSNVLSAKFYEYIENYSSGKDIRLYGMEKSVSESMANADLYVYKLFLRNEVTKSLVKLPETLLSNALKFGTYLVLIIASLAGAVSVGSIAKYVSCVMLLLSAISSAAESGQMLLFNHRYLERYFSYFDIPNNMYKGTLSVPKRDDNEYYIEFRGVSFRYPNAKEFALRNVSVRFKVGEKLAVVGMNGSGKTTFIKLLCRLYDPTEGEILLNGVDIRKYDYAEYMSVFSVVFQDFGLLSYTLGQNVAASVDYDGGRVTDCLRRAGFGDRIDSLPHGLDTFIYKDNDRDGVELSGGEAQKVALARALYKDAPFIILDEPTAALDPVSEYEIYSRFNGIVTDKTVIYISHRLASCRFCDKIAVFDSGSIIQLGTHAELSAAAGGKYAELWYAQAQYYAKAGDAKVMDAKVAAF